METEVVLSRPLLGSSVRQKSKSEFFLLNDLLAVGNKWRIANGRPFFSINSYWSRASTKEFVSELEQKYGKVKKSNRGADGGTWVHPLLFIDIALEISPTLKIEVYEWLFDNLIRYRNDSGDSYKEMAAALYKRCSNHKEFPKYISSVADAIRLDLGVKDWQTATENQLKRRDAIHHAIKLYSNVLTDPDQIVRISLKTA